MAESVVYVEVAFAISDKQLIIPVKLEQGASVQQAIYESGMLKQFPEIDLSQLKVGVFGKVCNLEKAVEQGDRVEIYRPLMQNPMEARRNRAVSGNLS
jgi:putative ubiquitin-RnfH superfamily antitoxin RatB of RatAB toxin-antitoxin module